MNLKDRKAKKQIYSMFALALFGTTCSVRLFAANSVNSPSPAPMSSTNVSDLARLSTEENSIYQKQLDEINNNVNARISDIDHQTTLRIDDLKSTIGYLIALLVAFAAIISWVGYNTIRKWIKYAIQERVNALVTEKYVGDIVTANSKPTFDKLLDEFESQAKARLAAIEKQHQHLESIGNEMQNKLTALQIKIEQDTAKTPALEAVKGAVDIEAIEGKNPSDRSSDDWFNIARFYYVEKENNNLAYEAIGKANSINPNKNSYVLAGLIARSMNLLDEAADNYGKAIQLDSSYARAYGLLARLLLLDQGRKDEAIELIRKAENLSKGNYGDLIICAFVYEAAELRSDAERTYREAMSLPDADADGVGFFAAFLVEDPKKHDEAEELFKRAIELDPKNSSVLNRYARFLEDIRNDYEKAEEFYKRAIVGTPASDYPCTAYANLLAYKLHDSSRAEKMYEEALRRSSEDPYALSCFARFLLEIQHDKPRAVTLFKRAKAADKDNKYNFSSVESFVELYGKSG